VSGGVALGLAVGYVIGEIRRRLDDPPTEITISLIIGYVAFLPAE
jgi:NhaP-type Na+/H+ or K+/H+ antiporter